MLRLIGLESAMDKFIEEGINSDIWFPFTTRSLPSCLGPGDKQRFLNSQHMVNTDVLYLEKNSESGKQCKHVHFVDEKDAPFIQIARFGRGSFGVVQKVQSKISHEFYARKQTPRNKLFLRSKEVVTAFKREREAVMKLNHRHCIEFVSLICLYKL
jgi:serine/threonine protein kinase